jgi:uncharacterized protein
VQYTAASTGGQSISEPRPHRSQDPWGYLSTTSTPSLTTYDWNPAKNGGAEERKPMIYWITNQVRTDRALAKGRTMSQGIYHRRGDVKIRVPTQEIAVFCRRHHIQKLAFFGSVLRDDFNQESDIDVLVEFMPGHTPGFAFFDIQEELSDLLGRPVDLHTPNFLSPYFRHEVEENASVQYIEE